MITKQRSLSNSALVADIIAITISFLVAAIASQSFAKLLLHSYMFALLPILIFTWYFFTSSAGFYKDIGARVYFEQVMQTFKFVVIHSFIIVFFIFIVKELLFTRNFMFIYSFLLLFLVFLRLIIYRKAMKHFRRTGKYERKLLVIGNPDAVETFVSDIINIPALGYEQIETFPLTSLEDDTMEATIARLSAVIENNNISEAVIAPSRVSEEKILRVIKLCNKFALHTFLLPDFLSLLPKNVSLSTIGNYPLFSIRTEPLEEFQMQVLKRTIDILFALLFFGLAGWWLLSILYILQKLFNPGPALYIQNRVGKNNKVFLCYKFRSMVSNKLDKEASTRDDARITRFGKILRKFNLDEFPQFINVLKGDMSLVGPRPHAVKFEERYKEYVDEIRLRSLVKPGITGWAQIHGLRGDVADPELNKLNIEKRIRHDIWYVENWSLSLDIKIILITIWQVIGSRNLGV